MISVFKSDGLWGDQAEIHTLLSSTRTSRAVSVRLIGSDFAFKTDAFRSYKMMSFCIQKVMVFFLSQRRESRCAGVGAAAVAGDPADAADAPPARARENSASFLP